MSQSQHEQLVSVATASRLLSCCARTVRRLIATGEIPAVKLGPKTIRIRREALLEWIRSKEARGE